MRKSHDGNINIHEKSRCRYHNYILCQGGSKINKRLILIDSSSYIYRAFYALPPLTSDKGMQTGAIYGFVRMLLKLIEDFKPEYIAAAFDSKGKQ